MASKFELTLGVLSVLLANPAIADDFDWTDDFTKCNVYRLVDQECPEENDGAGKRYTMIPATQRTNNVAGYAIDLTPWGTPTQLWMRMEAYTPRLEKNSVLDVYTSVKDHFDASVTLYDSVMCTLKVPDPKYFTTTVTADTGSVTDLEPGTQEEEFDIADYMSVTDFQSDAVLYDNVLSGKTYQTASAEYLDSANEGNIDWFLSPTAGDNSIECTDSYCTVVCTVYRTFITLDTANDVQYTEKATVQAASGFRIWDSQSTTTSMLGFGQGRSALIEVAYGAAFSSLSMTFATLAALTSLSWL